MLPGLSVLENQHTATVMSPVKHLLGLTDENINITVN